MVNQKNFFDAKHFHVNSKSCEARGETSEIALDAQSYLEKANQPNKFSSYCTSNYNILKHSLKTVKSVISNTDMMTSHVHFIVSLRFCRQVCRALRVLKQAESIHSFDSDIILIKHLTWSESDQDGLTVEFWRLLNSMTYLSHARCQLRHVGKKEPVPWCLASFCIDKLIQKFVPVCHDEIPDAHKGCFGLLLYHVQKQWKVVIKITCVLQQSQLICFQRTIQQQQVLGVTLILTVLCTTSSSRTTWFCVGW